MARDKFYMRADDVLNLVHVYKFGGDKGDHALCGAVAQYFSDNWHGWLDPPATCIWCIIADARRDVRDEEHDMWVDAIARGERSRT